MSGGTASTAGTCRTTTDACPASVARTPAPSAHMGFMKTTVVPGAPSTTPSATSIDSAAAVILAHMVQVELPGGRIVCDGCDHPYRTTRGFATDVQVTRHISRMLAAAGILTEPRPMSEHEPLPIG